ncbi:hypothetical protein [uncultured Bacteroides sp.]|uniref:hypothetical protein n=1 Tax=uncultured Bacteroides sp. TaxID=162156 RepID=UPI002AAC49DB|nr:hypothetical protein [uncultured Bacteroides sp.]
MGIVLTKCQKMNFLEFKVKLSCCRSSDDVFGQMEKLSKPRQVCGISVPEDLNDITYGQLIELQGITDNEQLFYVPCQVLLGLNRVKVNASDAEAIIGFVFWVAREVKRINKLFEATNVKPTAEEEQARIEKLNFGPFGLIDYYALRMGLTNHDEVLALPWVRIYQCMRIDSEKAKYERRLRKVYADKK